MGKGTNKTSKSKWEVWWEGRKQEGVRRAIILKTFEKSHWEACFHKCFLKYTPIKTESLKELPCNWEIIPLPDNRVYQIQSWGPGMGFLLVSAALVVSQWSFIHTFRHHTSWSLLLTVLRDLMVKPYCWRHHIFGPQDMQESSWCWPRSIIPHATKGIKVTNSLPQLWVLSVVAVIMSGLERYAHLWNSGMNVMGVTKSFLVGFIA